MDRFQAGIASVFNSIDSDKSEEYGSHRTNTIDLETLDVMKFARSIERDCEEAVKWEIRKLERILEEEAKAEKGTAA